MICLEFFLFSFYPHIRVLLFCLVFFLKGVMMFCDVCSSIAFHHQCENILQQYDSTVYSSEIWLDHVHTALDTLYTFPEIKHVKHIYIYLRYPWD